MDLRAIHRAMVVGGAIVTSIVAHGCGMPENLDDDLAELGPDAGVSETEQALVTPAVPSTFNITLVPDGVSGKQRVNFAIPFAPGRITSASAIRLTAGGVERPAARRILARHADGSARSVQLQLDLDVTTYKQLTVELGVTGASGPTLAAVSTTLTGTTTNIRPRVLAVLPPSVYVASGLAGPMLPSTSVVGTTLDTWTTKCDYTKWGTDAFLPLRSSRDVWLYDRVTTMYRGHMISGGISPLKSAHREAAIYLGGMTISNGVTTGIAVPSASTDLKYHYSQGLAIHYLLTGDDRYREAAEAVSARVASMWKPTYTGSFWTERHAGFALLAHEWAARVTDDQLTTINSRANTAASAFLTMQNAAVSGYSDTSARCFAHTASSHGESYGYTGCSPWMSAILADALDAHGQRMGGTRLAEVRTALGKLGRMIAKNGRDSIGRPFYWMGVGTSSDERDPYEEHWGEAAYVVALAWDATGRTDTTLRSAADSLAAGFRSRGTVPHMRSFNWQCRSAVATPALLK